MNLFSKSTLEDIIAPLAKIESQVEDHLKSLEAETSENFEKAKAFLDRNKEIEEIKTKGGAILTNLKQFLGKV